MARHLSLIVSEDMQSLGTLCMYKGPVLWDTTVHSVLVARCSHAYRETKMSC